MPRCAFCESTKVSKEHVFGHWLNELLQPGTIQYRWTEPDGSERTWLSKGAAPINQTASVVCEACNNGWMSEVESKHAAPILSNMVQHASPVSFLPAGLESLAIVSFKTAVIANHMRPPNGALFFPEQDRFEFRRSLTIPKGVQMWLSWTETQKVASGTLTTYSGHLDLNSKFSIEIFVCTFSIRFVVVQVLATKWISRKQRRREDPPYLAQGKEWEAAALPFWPDRTHHVTWPTVRPLDPAAITRLANRWHTLNVPKRMFGQSFPSTP